MSESETPPPGELHALTRLAFDEVGSAPGGIGDVHRAIAERVFRATGPAAAPVRAIHGAVAEASYSAVRAGFGWTGRLVAAAVADRAPELSSTPRGAALVAAVQGLRGDVLERDGSV